jgi:hypothetical protein
LGAGLAGGRRAAAFGAGLAAGLAVRLAAGLTEAGLLAEGFLRIAGLAGVLLT